MKRIILGIEYNGHLFSGWQYQNPQRRTIQSELQTALSKVANQTITVHCAGRTDAGVHALEQVVHFDTEVERPMKGWIEGTNCYLPAEIRVLWAQNAIDDFHARFSAIARFYRYIILNRKTRSALMPYQMTWCYEALDAEKMHQAAQALIGEHDFSSFRAQGCQSVSPNRLMHFIKVYRQQDKVIIDLSANAFLHHMVRNIAGVLIAIGMGKRPVDWTKELLAIKDRSKGGVTASPNGLYLGGVCYPKKYRLNKHPVFELLAPDVRRFEDF